MRKKEDYAFAVSNMNKKKKKIKERISNNSMALRVRYEQTLLFFYKMRFLYRDSSMKEGLFPI